MKRKTAFLATAVLFLVALDQATKWLVVTRMELYQSIPVIGEWIKLTFVYNQNGAFGLAPQRLLPFLSTRIFFVTFTIIAATVVFVLYFQTPSADRWTRLSLVLILGGAAGNFIDRVRLGKVVDFIDCDFPDFIMERWPVWNVADSCVTIGIAILFIITLFAKRRESHNKDNCPT
ncbi:MAG: signal peptidase II [Candidatus Raymondbacteria bacterium RifOxyA12_full_50_37]|uniref:Lipoprotein signal peptidase n=1 Tax=Candidatus Raymondbacteria bacterium RIFOXYD12_FULL_49_13 TaxID=1817890 RepID=A0A1F7FKS3_UNCRA|nr:MAG: signal peptidase II [Candidatus Raymondbacteria bacterium RifOxyA12_full_50_37]OGJ88812.1 MAG: signal peptidase II [Candidatus Raymondbacteria bacterium RIFOXYA2_FULL_49_16]OGJ96571.1 MAG: signal peptidase II [Candidatus Raymondbacteria bacterium RIFOXYC2_FULL_50_21]OGJ99155.1 MAG: signal peptidase II [Candidatus Raymondbacteria bacterium RifOxyC12_full_50_8]OGK04437.1 MAG: signal peptidase II [Candidatus Raymondbacteria bacterium RifOxyB12_full_50_8]OGK07191.1 MAG: signal peptidase II